MVDLFEFNLYLKVRGEGGGWGGGMGFVSVSATVGQRVHPPTSHSKLTTTRKIPG